MDEGAGNIFIKVCSSSMQIIASFFVSWRWLKMYVSRSAQDFFLLMPVSFRVYNKFYVSIIITTYTTAYLKSK